ncbi:hypothetical protein HanHA300_Chr10g0346301 [Helianthus annuus]|nr:hypothetical protein HanHA300_Chr10g0346301 [Helianthus annuus]KAJ0528557.1 hypothetical protein HanHA89_Chr10g0367731 [Helianthus annuus]KAJ0695484.1 hypothetical protein HanLR1_Chr10g0346141 [Helianthus annuus]
MQPWQFILFILKMSFGFMLSLNASSCDLLCFDKVIGQYTHAMMLGDGCHDHMATSRFVTCFGFVFL